MTASPAAPAGRVDVLRDPDGGQVAGRAMRGFAWAAASLALDKVLLFGATVVLARILSPADFGVVAAGLTVIRYLELVVDLGVGSAVVVDQQQGVTSRVETAATISVVMGVALTAVGVAAAPIVAAVFDAEQHVTLFRVLFLYVLLVGAAQVHDAVLRRDLDFRRRMALDVTRAVVRGGLSIALAFAGYGAWSIVLGLVVANAARSTLCWMLVRIRPRLRIDRVAARGMIRFGLTVVGVRAATEVIKNADYILVASSLGTTALGYYSIGYRLPELVIDSIYFVFLTVVFPVYARVRATDESQLGSSVLRALQLTTLYGFTTGIGLALVAHDAVILLFSSAWAPAILPMTLVSLSMALASIGAATGEAFTASGRPGILLTLNVASAPLVLGAYVIAAPHGIDAVASVHLAHAAVYALVHLVVVRRVVNVSWRALGGALRPACAASAGLLIVALPVRLVVPAGHARLGVVVAVGAAAAVVGVLTLSRSTVDDLVALGRRARA